MIGTPCGTVSSLGPYIVWYVHCVVVHSAEGAQYASYESPLGVWRNPVYKTS